MATGRSCFRQEFDRRHLALLVFARLLRVADVDYLWHNQARGPSCAVKRLARACVVVDSLCLCQTQKICMVCSGTNARAGLRNRVFSRQLLDHHDGLVHSRDRRTSDYSAGCARLSNRTSIWFVGTNVWVVVFVLCNLVYLWRND